MQQQNTPTISFVSSRRQMERGSLSFGEVHKAEQNLERGSGMSKWCDGTNEQETSSLAVSRFPGGAVKGLLHILVLAQVEGGSKFWDLA